MSDEHEVTEDVLTAGALIISTGSTDKAERALRTQHGLTLEQAQEATGEASMILISSAPREIRQSFETVCSWHRWNHIFDMSMSRGNISDAMEAQRQIDKLMARVH